jgi:N-succinyldiaminopimelate aminotransferase
MLTECLQLDRFVIKLGSRISQLFLENILSRPTTETNRWNQFGTSIFSEMSQKAAKIGAINLAQGFPNFDGPDEIKAAACAAIMSTKNQYAPANGIPELRQALSDHQYLRSTRRYCPDSEVTVFSGATEALFVSLNAMLDRDDEVLCFVPCYDSYAAAVLAAGARLKPIRLKPGTWNFSRDDLIAAITPRTRAVLVNTPHNPTGKVFSKEELDWIAELAIQHDLIIITDEVYEELLYDQSVHHHLGSDPRLLDRVITISSTSKTFSMTGWKIGYAFAPAPLTKLLRNLHQFTVFCSSTPLQWGMLAAFSLEQRYYAELRASYLERRDLLVRILQQSGFKVSAPKGSYFIVADYSDLSEQDNRSFADLLLTKVGIASIPLGPFYPGGDGDHLAFLRFAFCKDLETLRAAEARLNKADLRTVFC